MRQIWNRKGKDTQKNRAGIYAEKNRRTILLLGVLCVALVCIFSGTVFAKYYASKFRQGVSVASGFYFNSNRLIKSTGDITDITSIDTEGMAVNVNTERWTGGNLYFDIPIRNYDNNLLFNDENINVEYEIVFCLLDEPKGADYYVQNTQGQEMLLQKGVPVSCSDGRLPGGSLAEQIYRIRIAMTDAEQYSYARVLVMAYPVAPDYLYKEQNQEFRLLGVFEGVLSQTEMRVESAHFVVQEEKDYNASTWKEMVEDLSGLVYNIKTIGDVITDENGTVEQSVIVKWQSDYLELGQYDDYYKEALDKQANKTDTQADVIWQEQDGQGRNWTYMKIEVLPYTNANLTFYKESKFVDDFAVGTLTKDVFEKLVEVYKEGSGN